MLRLLPILLLAACAGHDGVARRWEDIKSRIREDFPEVDHWTTERVAAAVRADPPPVLVDVRSREEYERSHLARAFHVEPGGDLAVIPRDRTVVLYCSVGYRSAQVADRLRLAGYEDVHNYIGSIFEWANRGLPVVDAHGPTVRVHPFDEDWGQLLDERYR